MSRLLNAIVDRGAPIQANRTSALVRKLFNWAVAEGYLEASPAQAIPTRANEQARKRVLSAEELSDFWKALDDGVFEEITADALRLQLLLGARVREVTGMARSELSQEANRTIWTLPASRSKSGREVARPLPPLARSIVERRLKASADCLFVFSSLASAPGRPLTARAPSNALRRAGESGRV